MIKTRVLWTVKTKEEISLLKKNGFLKADKNISDTFWEGNFIPAYQWMSEQMKAKIPSYGDNYPLWAWVDRPDFRSYRREIKEGESLFLIKFIKNEKDILISDFDLWHFVISGIPLLCSDQDIEDFEKKYGFSFSLWRNPDISKKEIQKIKKGWENIFTKDGKNLQATFEKLNLSEILDIKEYKK